MRSSLRIQKSLCRKRLRRILNRLSASAIRSKSAKIAQKVIKLPSFTDANRILIYQALPKEVQTMTLVRTALRRGKEVYAPVVDLSKKTIRVARFYHPRHDLKKSAYGIMEPTNRRSEEKRISEFDIIIVPGIGFDRLGRRLGRGGGYFDRFLKKTGKALKLGIAFSEQVVKKIPSNKKDVRMDRIITD